MGHKLMCDDETGSTFINELAILMKKHDVTINEYNDYGNRRFVDPFNAFIGPSFKLTLKEVFRYINGDC